MQDLRHKREDETIKEWLQRTSKKDSTWLKKAKRRRKYKRWYALKFYIKMKFYGARRKINRTFANK